MGAHDFIREKQVERLVFEATDAGFRKVSRITEVTDRETQIIASYDLAAQRIVVTERELTSFRTGATPVEYDWLRLSLTLDEARALNARLSRLLADAQSEGA
ncbi:hypothetical protein [Methylobacterium sp. D48H]